MKKTIIAVFSVSLTAGTIYLSYSQLKGFFIKKLIRLWKEAAAKQNKQLNEIYINGELDKLYLWDVKILITYSQKIMQDVSEKEREELRSKLKEKQLLEKADLQSLQGIIF